MDYVQLTTAEGEKLSSLANLDPENQLQDLLLHKETLEPNRRSSRNHSHTTKQEFVFVLKGALSLFENSTKLCVLEEGESFCFPSRKSSYHYFKNESEKNVDYLSVATNFKNDKVSFKD